MNQRLVVFILVLAGCLSAQISPEQSVQIERLEKQLIAPCCWQEPISEHRSEIAGQMKAEVRQMVAAGKTDREILDHYKAEYGMRVLVEPEGSLWWWMNVIPVLVLILGAVVAVFVLKRWRQPIPEESEPEPGRS